MSDKSAICRVCSAVFSALLASAFLMPVAQADEVPIQFSYTGTGFDIPVFDYTVDPYPSNLVQGPTTGSFGPSHSLIMTKFEYIDDTTCGEGVYYFRIIYGASVITFKDGSQLWGYVIPGPDSDMCLDPATGAFEGQATGIFAGGSGRFENVGGNFVQVFDGLNLTSAQLGHVGFRSIKGTTTGTLVFY